MRGGVFSVMRKGAEVDIARKWELIPLNYSTAEVDIARKWELIPLDYSMAEVNITKEWEIVPLSPLPGLPLNSIYRKRKKENE